jgi:lipopolysaccharide/colanic/teichoic acid biosynthesis glycosyltransferase
LAGFSRRLLGPERGLRRGSVGKRVLDVVLSGALLVLAGPVLLVCAVVLRAMDGPGVVFRQERIGKDGRPFTMLKLRTHRPASDHEAATRWSVANEQDMSAFCHFLRRTSLDELLQLWNVFRGDMSLVGPRPERPFFVAKFSQAHPGYPARHRMRTGITGLAQIHGLRGDTSIEDRCRYDNAYIDNWSLWQDVCILLRTAAQFVRPTGS